MRALLLALAFSLAACQTSTEPLDEPAPGASPETSGDLMPTEPGTDAMMGGAEVVAEGAFAGASGHETSGQALLLRLDDGSHVVRLTGFETDNGPDLRVRIVRNMVDDTQPPVDLGDLKSTRGDQNYPVPADASLDTSQPLGVSIWCRAFSVGFGTAALAK